MVKKCHVYVIVQNQYYQTLIKNVTDAMSMVIGGGGTGATQTLAEQIKTLAAYLKPNFELFNSIFSQLDWFLSYNTADLPNLPTMASGGIVRRPTLAMIGESGAEAVIPLNKMGSMGGINLSFSGIFLGSKGEMDTAFRKYIKPALENYLSKTGAELG